MRLVDSRDLIPAFMRDDSSVKGLCAAIDVITRELTSCLARSAVFLGIESMDSQQLDYLADMEDITWYRSDMDLLEKIRILTSRKKIYAKLGTYYAVEQTVRDIWGNENVRVISSKEDSGIEPFHFAVEGEQDTLTYQPAKHAKMLANIEKTKNVRSVMDYFAWVEKTYEEGRNLWTDNREDVTETLVCEVINHA